MNNTSSRTLMLLGCFAMSFSLGHWWARYKNESITFKTYNTSTTHALTKNELIKVNEFKIQLIKERKK